jgi:DNA-binding LacI/PurR family transcriptional regulator
VESVAGLALDALVFAMCGPAYNPLVEHLSGRGIPMAGTGGPLDGRVHQVVIDEAGGQRAAVRHLRSLGHRRIAHVTMPLFPLSSGGRLTPVDLGRATYADTRLRAEGFLAAAGRRAEMVEAARPDVESGIVAARLLLDRPAEERPTAVVAQSDLLAVGVIRAAAELGLSVPADLSVTGFDGVDLPWLPTPLTTVDQHGEEKGRTLGRLVARLLDDPAPREVETLLMPTHLRVGGTTAPPRHRAAVPHRRSGA